MIAKRTRAALSRARRGCAARACRAPAAATSGRSRAVARSAVRVSGPGLREFPPVAAQAVEPLAAHVIVDMLDAVAVGRDRQIAALRRRPVHVGGSEMQRAQGAGRARRHARRCRSHSFRACRRSYSRSRRRCRSRHRRRTERPASTNPVHCAGMNGLKAVIRTCPGKAVAMERDLGDREIGR